VQIVCGPNWLIPLDDTSIEHRAPPKLRRRRDHARCDGGREEGRIGAHFDLIQITQRIPHVQRSILSR
jgi:hypothetical protein